MFYSENGKPDVLCLSNLLIASFLSSYATHSNSPNDEDEFLMDNNSLYLKSLENKFDTVSENQELHKAACILWKQKTSETSGFPSLSEISL